MGKYAEMMLDGTCCVQCGEFIGSDAGYPIFCRGCGGDQNGFLPELSMTRKQKADRAVDKGERVRFKPISTTGQDHKPWVCQCGKRFRLESGARNHWNDSHRPRPDQPAIAARKDAA